MKVFNRNLKDNKKIAQSASELAIFGAILIFVIGLVLRTGLFQGQAMNAHLRSMRMALTESFKTAQGEYRTGSNYRKPSGARSTAAVLVVEDRLSVDPSQKEGSRDRIPLMTSASATFTNHLFWTLDFGNSLLGQESNLGFTPE